MVLELTTLRSRAASPWASHTLHQTSTIFKCHFNHSQWQMDFERTVRRCRRTTNDEKVEYVLTGVNWRPSVRTRPKDMSWRNALKSWAQDRLLLPKQGGRCGRTEHRAVAAPRSSRHAPRTVSGTGPSLTPSIPHTHEDTSSRKRLSDQPGRTEMGFKPRLI